MKVVALIPARYESVRFPGKMLASLGGKPVIVRTYEAVKKTNLFQEVYVVTDSELIFNEVIYHGGQALKSQQEHQCGSSRIAEVAENMDADIILNVQGDEPFTKKEALEKLLDTFYSKNGGKVDVASLMQRLEDRSQIEDPNFVKVVVDKENDALFFSRLPIPYVSDSDLSPIYYEHIGVYAFRKQALIDFSQSPSSFLELAEKIECLRYLDMGKKIKMVEINYMGIEIDTKEDLEKAQAFF